MGAHGRPIRPGISPGAGAPARATRVFQGKLCRRLFIPTMPTHKAMATVTRDSKDSAISTIQVETDLAAESGKANHD